MGLMLLGGCAVVFGIVVGGMALEFEAGLAAGLGALLAGTLVLEFAWLGAVVRRGTLHARESATLDAEVPEAPEHNDGSDT